MTCTRLNPTHVQNVTLSVNLKRPDTAVTLKGIDVNGIQVLYAEVTCATSSASNGTYLEFQTSGYSRMVTFGTWGNAAGTLSGIITEEGNNNAWLKGATGASLSGAKIFIQLVRIPMPA